MTVVLNKPADFDPAHWSSMPGWNITVDLTPPELRARRSLAVLRRVVAGVLALVVLLCVGGYLLAAHAKSDAQAQLDDVTARTAGIQAALGRHSAVTRVQAATSAIETQLATLFAGDVDVPKLIADLPNPDPNRLTVTSISLSISNDPLPAAAGSVATIGTVTMSGSAQRLTDLADEVKALGSVRGVTDVIPTTNSASAKGTAWTLTFAITDARYSHRFATAPGATPSSTPSSTPSNGGK